MPTTVPNPDRQQPWPTGVNARLVTRMGVLLDNWDATVDITTHDNLAPTHDAHCRPCGWTAHLDTNRNKVVDKAQKHADRCTALPTPTSPATVQSAIHHSA